MINFIAIKEFVTDPKFIIVMAVVLWTTVVHQTSYNAGFDASENDHLNALKEARQAHDKKLQAALVKNKEIAEAEKLAVIKRLEKERERNRLMTERQNEIDNIQTECQRLGDDFMRLYREICIASGYCVEGKRLSISDNPVVADTLR